MKLTQEQVNEINVLLVRLRMTRAEPYVIDGWKQFCMFDSVVLEPTQPFERIKRLRNIVEHFERHDAHQE
ncbi:hypothetical protein [Paraburkholderia unamae]|uniref:Uncharacterized protein n=1 Tax=Paraburkholderia unamae TaxID=219649 RepID=A0ACC6RGM4_9BURK